MGIIDRIKEIEDEMKRTQINKATEGHLGRLKAKLAKLRTELLDEGKSSGGGGEGFDVAKSGDGRVALIGFPSVGKSTMLSQLTETQSETNAVEFTTLTCIPGNLIYNDVRIQLLDLPGIIEGAAHGRGRGREVIAVAKSADMILMVLDAGREAGNRHREILENELETVGLRLNRQPPDIYFRKKNGGGITFNSTLRLTKLGDDPYQTVYKILHEYKLHNCEVLFREDCTTDDLIDVIEGNRKYVKCLYVYNKIDVVSIEDVDRLARMPNSTVIACAHGDRPALNFDTLLAKMWDYMGLTRVYTKRRGEAPQFEEPVVLGSERKGVSVHSACMSISKDMLDNFNYALVWGTSTKYNPQRVGKEHMLHDEDVLQVIVKTANQQKRDKNYNQKVQAYFDKYKKKKKALKT
ncbi:Developmentally-regulated GTP-binding protein 2 [Phytophthora pseudosyringae]|uniref:Developmentally-regulated GTP-binding protein 2 n=1 Tax=Phytophthora pseudosyringae TaxID=221518 RepID=A0A8T1W8Q6_9STRA|nr:Developmentally-regulated GTP-binding protein 2 [Phytophthora pseudosyringae]